MIHPSMQLEKDCPSLHENQKLPILDIKVRVEKKTGRENIKDEDKDSNREYEKYQHQIRIMHEYYYKEVATKAVVDARSAIPWESRRTIITPRVSERRCGYQQ